MFSFIVLVINISCFFIWSGLPQFMRVNKDPDSNPGVVSIDSYKQHNYINL